MTTPNGTVADHIEGIVEAANERGIKVAGEWRNQSKFHPVDLPDRGARVRVSLDPKGFIQSLDVLAAAPSSTSASSSDRERMINRLTVLKAAANFTGLWGQARPEIKSDHVLVLAEKWLAWVEQEEEQ